LSWGIWGKGLVKKKRRKDSQNRIQEESKRGPTGRGETPLKAGGGEAYRVKELSKTEKGADRLRKRMTNELVLEKKNGGGYDWSRLQGRE